MRSIVFGLLLLAVSGTRVFAAVAMVAPDWNQTPGVVCTQNDPDFKGFEFPEQIARCNRNVPMEEKSAVAKNYGDIPRSDWSNYEFDHLIPLCAGGSNNIGNIWPQPIEQAKRKDVLENEICSGLRDGSMTQATAIQRVRDWFAAGEVSPTNPLPVPPAGSSSPTPSSGGDSIFIR